MMYIEEPNDFKKEIEVVGCYIQHDGEFVLLLRHAHKTNGDRFGVPAGKIDSGESPLQAMHREIREETGLDIPEEKLEYFELRYVRNEGHDFIYHMFSTNLDERPQIRINDYEHKDFIWTTPARALQMPDLMHDLDECIRIFYHI